MNLQNTGVLVNYDLPWNPMKVEQRIGRIDRIGQQNPVIRVVNLAYKDTVEADVYFALGKRINLFHGIVGRLQPILSRLPKQFEQVSLEPVQHREAARRPLLADVEQSVDKPPEAGFDIDEVAQEALEQPKLPDPALTLRDIEEVLNTGAARLPATQWKPLDNGSYSVQLPGMASAVRATPVADVFDDHCDSHLFLSPGGWLFQQLADGAAENGEEITGETEGRIWLVQANDSGVTELFVATPDGPRRIEAMGELLNTCRNLGPPACLDPGQYPGSRVTVLL